MECLSFLKILRYPEFTFRLTRKGTSAVTEKINEFPFQFPIKLTKTLKPKAILEQSLQWGRGRRHTTSLIYL